MMVNNGNALKAKLQDAAARNGFDALIAMSPENFGYVSGMYIPTLQLIRGRTAVAVIPAQGEAHLIVCTIEKTVAEAESWIRDATFYTEMVDDPIAIAAGVLRGLGLEKGRIAVDADYLPMNDYRTLSAALPEATLVDGNPAITALRAVKGDEEIARLGHATRATHRAAITAMAAARAGETERQLCASLVSQLLIQGADVPLFLVLASGENGRHIHPTPSDKIVELGDIVRFDFGGRFGAVPSDLARTYSAGDPSAEQKQVYAALARVQAATVAAVAPDITAADLFDHCRTLFRGEGVDYRLPHIGHNMGHEFHEPPLLRPADKTRLKPGMTLNIEPVAFDGSGIVYHLEDLVEVTESGGRILSLGLAPPELPLLGQTLTYV
jgi:Xaa-Pro dipeptidase